MKKIGLILSVIFIVLMIGACSQTDDASGDGAETSSDEIVMTWGNVYSSTMPFNQGINKVQDILESESDGQISIDLYPDSQLGSNSDLMSNLVGGTSQIGNEGGGFLSQWVPEFSVSEAVYAFNDVDHMFSVMDGPIGQDMFDKLLEERSVRVIDVWYYGTRHVTSNKEINTPGDLEGIKMRVPDGPLYIANGEALGADPTPMPLSEVYLALQTGTIDAQENPLSAIDSYKYYEVQDYINLTAHNYNFNVIMVNEEFWQGLTDDQRTLIEEAIKEGGETTLSLTLEQEESLITELEEQGVIINEPNLEEFEQQAGEKMIESYQNEWDEGFYESVKEYE
ncbi:sialic acid TRAP transporter substrate-binding protein SiaP [Virgibacillus sp. CBA3643]|uniref:sialic acid TRAP transporter substrate-binding protein SiaP n=1 Tax=Virgibacillus sp. CBA3643 TaxID=2942278 RepID=UPI0035A29684